LTHNERGLGTNFVKFVKNVKNINFYEFQAPSKFPLLFPDSLGSPSQNSSEKSQTALPLPAIPSLIVLIDYINYFFAKIIQ
jgi:hypothetical protein